MAQLALYGAETPLGAAVISCFIATLALRRGLSERAVVRA